MSTVLSPLERIQEAIMEVALESEVLIPIPLAARISVKVLEAIREPSEAMVKAGNRSKPFNVTGYCEGTIHPVVQRAWPVMIDAALADEEDTQS